MQYAAEKSTEHLKKYIGKTLEVLIESYDTEQNIYLGRTAFQSPDIDGITQVKGCSQADLYKFIKVKITDSLTYDLIGEKPGYISADDNENTIY
jgi:ribosomal protein S12 methylthiotransferase